jgi:hypothetical protein
MSLEKDSALSPRGLPAAIGDSPESTLYFNYPAVIAVAGAAI